ncbi:MAG: hypothetical protein JXB10_18365 [Pirellulales bacterium]|nr:hypothetical protein [Pirellulales bacterium]
MLVEAAGIEPTLKTTEKQGDRSVRGAESGAQNAENRPIDPDLGAIIDAWPKLPDPIKAGILAMVRAAGGKSNEVERRDLDWSIPPPGHPA